MKLTLSLYYASCVFWITAAMGSELHCSGDLMVVDQLGKNHSLSSALVLSKESSFKFTVLDQNQREILKVWPWGTVQTKVLIAGNESRQRNLEIHTNEFSWLSVDVDSTSSKARNSLRCEFEE